MDTTASLRPGDLVRIVKESDTAQNRDYDARYGLHLGTIAIVHQIESPRWAHVQVDPLGEHGLLVTADQIEYVGAIDGV